jgi:hypothetical protein
MKTKLLFAAAISALSLGAAGAQAAPSLALNGVTPQNDGIAVEKATYYGYYYRPYYYPYYRPYYFYRPYYKPYYYY